MIARCSNVACRALLAEHPAQCPHGLAFCGDCVWEESCAECAPPAPDLFAALARSTDQAREIRLAEYTPPPRVVTTCRCGAAESQGRETRPVEDLRGGPGVSAVIRADSLRRCRTCPHGIHVGTTCVRYSPSAPTSVITYHYHPECVVTS